MITSVYVKYFSNHKFATHASSEITRRRTDWGFSVDMSCVTLGETRVKEIVGRIPSNERGINNPLKY